MTHQEFATAMAIIGACVGALTLIVRAGRRPPPPASPPPGAGLAAAQAGGPAVTPARRWAAGELLGPVLVDRLNIPAWIEYADADGVVSTRAICIHEMHGEMRDTYPFLWGLHAYCHVRRDVRHFRIDRILLLRIGEQAAGVSGLMPVVVALRDAAGLAAPDRTSSHG